MSFNKNGLEIKLNFDHSINEQDLLEIEEISNKLPINKIDNNVSSFFFLSQRKETKFEKYSYNFFLISKIKTSNKFIINKITKFDIIKTAKDKNENNEKTQTHIFEIIKIDNINLKSAENEIKEEKKDIQEDIKKDIDNKKDTKEGEKEKEKENINESPKTIINQENMKIDDKKVFSNLIISNENNSFIIGKKREIKLDIQNSINSIEIQGIQKEKKFNTMNIESQVNNLEIIKPEKLEKIDNELKSQRTEIIDIKSKQKEKILNIESNNILIQINGINRPPLPKKILDIQKNIIKFDIIQNSKKFLNYVVTNIINFEIKCQQIKKKPELLFKKVETFLNPSDKLYSKKENTKIIDANKDSKDSKLSKESKEIENKKNKKEIKLKLDKYKTKSPNQIQINPVISYPANTYKNNIKLENNYINNNYDNRDKKDKEDEKKLDTLNTEIINNKESIQIPMINTDIIHLEKQYEKIKKDLNELYPIFSKNKQYRENFFVQLSQGNQGKYNFYLSLYKIIKDEQEEKKNNNFENYLKMRKIINGKSSGFHNKIKAKLRPLKKNSSSCSIKARNKIFPFYTEGNNNY